MTSVMSFQRKREAKQNASTGIFLSTVGIHLHGEQSKVRGALDLFTQDWLDQLVWEGISQSILPSNHGLELRSITVEKAKSESTCLRTLIAQLNGLSEPDKNLVCSLDQTLVSLVTGLKYLEKSWNITLKPEQVDFLRTLIYYVLSRSSEPKSLNAAKELLKQL